MGKNSKELAANRREQAKWRKDHADELATARRVAGALVTFQYPLDGTTKANAIERERRLAEVADRLRVCGMSRADRDRLGVMLGMTATKLQAIKDVYKKRGKS